MEIKVKGHSGCLIEIVQEGEELYVLKSTADPSYGPRLIRQAEKQKEACSLIYRNIHVPAILGVESDAAGTTVKMEYVYSQDFIEYFENAGFGQIEFFTDTIIGFVKDEIKASDMTVVEGDILRAKFIQVKDRIKGNPLTANLQDVEEVLGLSEKVFEDIKEMALPLGVCHGDLTFSNILFSDRGFYLIDYLDSFLESPIVDIVKLRQDSAFGWSGQMYRSRYDKLRMEIICGSIDRAIDSAFQNYPWYRDYYGAFQLMNFLRVLQYARDKEVVFTLVSDLMRICDGL